MFGALLHSVERIRGGKRSAGTSPPLQKAAPAEASSANSAPRFNPKVQWWDNPEWLARFERHLLPDGFNGRHPHRILDRRFTLAEFAKTALSLRGSTAECGVFRGIGSALICETLQGTYGHEDRHFGFDSFEGLPEPGPHDARWMHGELAEPITTAQKHLAEFRFVELVPGWLPQTLTIAAERRFRLIHIDVDLEQATGQCLAFFYVRAVLGAVFVFDDYGFKSCPGARRAVTAFLGDKPESLVELTTGQAVFFKK